MKRVLLVALLVGGCRSSVEPLTGDIYILESINGSRLPAPYQPGTELVNRIHADTISLESDGTGERRTRYDSYQGTTRLERLTLTYTRTGNRIELALSCPGPEPCVAAPQLAGTVTSVDLTITESKITRLPLVYTKH